MLTPNFILSCRSAFVLYKAKGMEAVKEKFPENVSFVEKHRNLYILEVTELLTKELDKSGGG
jgi:hypothetical protein